MTTNCVVCCKSLNAAFGSKSVKDKLRAVLNHRGPFICPGKKKTGSRTQRCRARRRPPTRPCSGRSSATRPHQAAHPEDASQHHPGCIPKEACGGGSFVAAGAAPSQGSDLNLEWQNHLQPARTDRRRREIPPCGPQRQRLNRRSFRQKRETRFLGQAIVT